MLDSLMSPLLLSITFAPIILVSQFMDSLFLLPTVLCVQVLLSSSRCLAGSEPALQTTFAKSVQRVKFY
jgi:hypothetical protein